MIKFLEEKIKSKQKEILEREKEIAKLKLELQDISGRKNLSNINSCLYKVVKIITTNYYSENTIYIGRLTNYSFDDDTSEIILNFDFLLKATKDKQIFSKYSTFRLNYSNLEGFSIVEGDELGQLTKDLDIIKSYLLC